MFAHVPVLVNEKRQKLSKRRDKVALEDYRDEGYLADAMRNYLMLLGWAPKGDDEIVPWPVIEEQFRLEDVVPSPAFFDVKKLTAFNGEYIRQLSPEQFVDASRPWLGELSPDAFVEVRDHGPARPGAGEGAVRGAGLRRLLRRRARSCPTTSPRPPRTSGPRACSTTWPTAFEQVDWKADDLKAVVVAVAEGRGLKVAKAQAPVRVAVTGRTVGPPLFESLELLGRAATLERIRAARARL